MATHHSVYNIELPQKDFSVEPNVHRIPSPLDPSYLAWLGNSTSNLWPLIRFNDDQLARHIFSQSFDHGDINASMSHDIERALAPLCKKYGPLDQNATLDIVSPAAWVSMYRATYAFGGSDTSLLSFIAQAYDTIKNDLMEADRANDHLFDTTPTSSPPRATKKLFTRSAQTIPDTPITKSSSGDVKVGALEKLPYTSEDDGVGEDENYDGEQEQDCYDPTEGNYRGRGSVGRY